MALSIPDRLVILTFDDGKRSHATFVGPLLKRHGFGATFFITEGLDFPNKQLYLTWDQIRQLHEAGFEIGHHTQRHCDVRQMSAEAFGADLEQLEERFEQEGLPRPATFCYPGYHVSRAAVAVLGRKGYRFARRGVFPEFPRDKTGENGPAYNPLQDHPLLVPTTGASGVHWTFSAFIEAVEQARDGRIAVLSFHGAPCDHPTTSTPPQRFEAFMDYLKQHKFTVIGLRDTDRYVDLDQSLPDPFAPIRQRTGVAALDAF